MASSRDLPQTDLPTRQLSLLLVSWCFTFWCWQSHARHCFVHQNFPLAFCKQIAPPAHFFLAYPSFTLRMTEQQHWEDAECFPCPLLVAGFQDLSICLSEPASHVMRTRLQNWETKLEQIFQIDSIHHCPTIFRERLWENRSLSTHGPTDSLVQDWFHWHGHAHARPTPPARTLLPTHSRVHQLHLPW